MHDAQEDKHVGDHDGSEKLEEILNPQMHHPKAPKVCGRKVGMRAGQQPDRVKRRDRECGEEKQPGHIADGLAVEASADSTENKDDPEDQPDGKQHLPESAKVQIFKTLGPKPRPPLLNPAADSRVLACQAPKDHKSQSEEQSIRKPMLTFRLFAGDHRNEKNSRREK